MITRCICKDLPFLGLLSYARRHGLTTVEELMRATGCGTGCGTCRPYVAELLRTGRVWAGDRWIDLPKMDVPLDIPPPTDKEDDQEE